MAHWRRVCRRPRPGSGSRLPTNRMVRMALDPAAFRRPPTDPPGLVRLGHADAAELHDLYAEYPDSAFVDDMLAGGAFYGVRLDGRLLAAAGTHVVARH